MPCKESGLDVGRDTFLPTWYLRRNKSEDALAGPFERRANVPVSPGEQGWNPGKHEWVTGNSIQSSLGMGGADWDDITKAQGESFAPEAFSEPEGQSRDDKP